MLFANDEVINLKVSKAKIVSLVLQLYLKPNCASVTLFSSDHVLYLLFNTKVKKKKFTHVANKTDSF